MLFDLPLMGPGSHCNSIEKFGPTHFGSKPITFDMGDIKMLIAVPKSFPGLRNFRMIMYEIERSQPPSKNCLLTFVCDH